MATLSLELVRLSGDGAGATEVPAYDLVKLRQRKWEWDRVVKASHPSACAWQLNCNYNVYVKDGVALREEQAGLYPGFNDPAIPDYNPRGCQKGSCYCHRMYDPTRIKFPMKRVGDRGEGKWQRVSWDQALAEVADAIIDTLTTDGPDAIVLGGGNHVLSAASDGAGANAFFIALGVSLPTSTTEIGDDFQGVGVTFGKAIMGCSPDNYFYADLLLLWGGNPAYTNIPNYHFITEARYSGTKVIAICPDYSASATHADLWVPVNIGTDAALALSMCQVILKERLYKAEFVREQTDLPLLVDQRTGKFLREKDLKRDGHEGVFYVYDTASGRVVEAPRKTLALGGIVPALEGTYQVETLRGRLAVQPVMELLRRHLDERFTPEQASAITGVKAGMIEQVAREIAAARGVVNTSTTLWGKFYHGDLIERAIILVFALCGHLGRKGAAYSAHCQLALDTSLGGMERRGDQVLLSAAGADPRFAAWREDGFTDEMILSEFVHQSFEQGSVIPSSMMYYLHGGLLELSQKYNSWDPHLKRPVGEYVKEAFAKGWQYPAPARGKEPRLLFALGGNFLRRVRASEVLVKHLLPKLRLLVDVDWRWNSSALHSDLVLPVSSWYERTATLMFGRGPVPFAHVNERAAEPQHESKSEWALFVLLARKVEERARQRGIAGYVDRNGVERRFAGLEEKITAQGSYTEDDEEGVARDTFLNARNVEQMDWQDFKERGFSRFNAIGTALRGIGHATEVTPGESIVPLTWHVGVQKQPYPTLTRRIQFYIDHELYLELGEAMPTYKDPPKAGGNYPLQMTGGHARWSLHSNWVDDTLLLQLQRGEPVMFMSDEDARRRGIQDGDMVEVYNDVGRFQIQSVVTSRMRPGQVAVLHAWENYQFPGQCHFKNVQPAPLNPIELAGGYFQLRPIAIHSQPGQSDRDTRVEVRHL